MNKLYVPLSALIFLWDTCRADAHIGRTAAQCDAEYGRPFFTCSDAALEFRSYHNREKTVRIAFSNHLSTIEQITIGPKATPSPEKTKTAAADALLSIEILLATEYNFTDAQLEQLTRTTAMSPTQLVSEAANENVRVVCLSEINETAGTLTFIAMIARVQSETLLRSVSDFLLRSIARELSR